MTTRSNTDVCADPQQACVLCGPPSATATEGEECCLRCRPIVTHRPALAVDNGSNIPNATVSTTRRNDREEQE